MTNEETLEAEVVESESATDFSEPAIIVFKSPLPDGNSRINLALINGLDPLAAPAMLQLALKAQKEQLGID